MTGTPGRPVRYKMDAVRRQPGPGGRASRRRPARILVSSCLLGVCVRYDGGHKRDAFVADTLCRLAECIPICPETGCGLPVPREPMRLSGDASAPRLVGVESGADHTARLASWAERALAELARLGPAGYVCKEGSPSCGKEGVGVFLASGEPAGSAAGLFTRMFMERFPDLPVEEESRLRDARSRAEFLEKILGRSRIRGRR